MAKKDEFKQLTESINSAHLEIIEAEDDVCRIRINDAVVADIINANGRIYPDAVLREAYEELKASMGGTVGQGRLRVSGVSTGEGEHPSSRYESPNWTKTIVRWDTAEWGESVNFDGVNAIHLTGTVLPTNEGMDAIVLLRSGVLPGASLRGRGLSAHVMGEDGREVEEVQKLQLIAFDLVGTPSFSNNVSLLESMKSVYENAHSQRGDEPMSTTKTQEKANQEGGEVEVPVTLTPDAILKSNPDLAQKIYEAQRLENEAKEKELLEHAREKEKRQREMFAQREAELREAAGVDEHDDLAEVIRKKNQEFERLASEKRQREVKELIEGEIEKTDYDEATLDLYAEALRGAIKGVDSLEEAKKIVTQKRSEYNKVAAATKRLEMGYQSRHGGLAYLGESFEQEYGLPTYARQAMPLIENLSRTQNGIPLWNPLKPKDRAQQFAADYINRFIEKNQHHLQAESKAFEEANTTSDLNLPYTVALAVLFEAYPQLITAQIFDFGMANGSTERVYVEKWEEDSGLYTTVTNEDINVTAAGTEFAIANQWITPGSETVVHDPGGTADVLTFAEDYIINYRTGQLVILSGSTIVTGFPATIRLTTYQYDNINSPEGSEAALTKLTTVPFTLEISTMKLAAEITHEAMVFSRADLNYDLGQRNITHLIRVIREKIDRFILHQALYEAQSLAANYPNGTPPTWNATTGSVQDLIEQIGLAKVLLMTRNYMPDAIVTSPTIAEVLSNWSLFTDNAQVSLGANGLAGSVKGLPVYTSNLFPADDNSVLVVNRQMLLHRVLTPMSIKGPLAKYGANGIPTGDDFWLATEDNGQIIPIPEKGSFVRVV